MAKKNIEEILKTFSELVGDDNRDEVLSFMEDLTDSYNDNGFDEIERLKNELEAERMRYDEADAAWRKRYRDRFYSDERDIIKIEEKDEPKEGVEKENPEKITIEDIFSKKEER